MFISESDIKIIEKFDKNFPKQLYDLKDCPDKLYVIGNQEILNKFSIAIVGARNCKNESRAYAKKISYGLAKQDVVIVSGLARGIDAVAHESCLDAKGKTIAVLGGGFYDIYPKENIKLFYRILNENGLIISEYAPNEHPIGYHFLMRNRIVAALSKGVVLIEAKENSGSITTAKHALKLKRKLFVLPGSVEDKGFVGSNKLLTEGAKCILDSEDVLRAYKKWKNNKVMKEFVKAISVPDEYIKIYELLSSKPKTINQISIELQMPMHELSSKLTFMEIEGYVKQLPGKCFVKS